MLALCDFLGLTQLKVVYNVMYIAGKGLMGSLRERNADAHSESWTDEHIPEKRFEGARNSAAP